MRITVIGSGHVGLVSGACFAELGHDVIVVDNDPTKYEALQRGVCPIHEQYVPELFQRHRGTRLVFSDALADSVGESEAIFIAVGTPPTSMARPIFPTLNRSRAKLLPASSSTKS